MCSFVAAGSHHYVVVASSRQIAHRRAPTSRYASVERALLKLWPVLPVSSTAPVAQREKPACFAIESLNSVFLLPQWLARWRRLA